MALITCHECKASISDSAKTCPQCGAKAKKPTSKLALFFAGLVLIFIIKGIVSSNDEKPTQAAPQKTAEQLAAEAKREAQFQRVVQGARTIKAAMKNPASFSLESAVLMDDGSVCYEYRGTNSFNAITLEQSVLTTKDNFTKDPKDWNRYCGGKQGTDHSKAKYAM